MTALRAAAADDLAADVGPIIRPASGTTRDALTRLDAGEHWLVEPRPTDESGTLWSPGVRTGVTPLSPFALTAHPAPVLGVVHVSTLEEAIAVQNGSGAALAAGLHSLDPMEVAQWLAGAEASNLVINAAFSGGAGQMDPLDGRRRASVIPFDGNALLQLGDWRAEPGTESADISLAGLDDRVRELLESTIDVLDWRQFDGVRSAALSDQDAWGDVFGAAGVSEPGAEPAVLRYRPVPVVVRLAEGEPLEKLVRVLAAGTRAHASLGVTTALKLPRPLRALLKERRVRVFVENDAAWLERASKVGAGSSRIRMIGGDVRALADALAGSPDVAVFAGEVTGGGRIELLPFLREQTVRAGNAPTSR
ncbi:hypothetical protein B7R25_00975 [Subtercola boreus]|uniref:Aldehyde dehydrogenase domain-containing protein n=1 Tax=Subtercola boreus TaxID=120213 RepID=A0A3E0WEP2_9MICO|nr:hypothetical protein B7R24_00980 [Subtercola boreus]RFA23888.1 hypothetical protein B7R23_00980 [Subtercola boreus]RFA29588.1 hypothetical protein B7R25_00975 [Subtercola boreus]